MTLRYIFIYLRGKIEFLHLLYRSLRFLLHELGIPRSSLQQHFSLHLAQWSLI